MSTYYRSLALEETAVLPSDINDLLPLLNLSISSISTDTQPVIHVVKVSGNITVSF